MASEQAPQAPQVSDVEVPQVPVQEGQGASPAPADSSDAPEEQSQPTAMQEETPTGAGAAARGFTIRTRLSTWRIPEVGKDVPLYVQRAFRVKTFALLALQQAACFAIMMCLRTSAWAAHPMQRSLEVEAIYYVLSFVNILILMQLWLLRDRYPCNYVLMTVMTITTAVLWSLTETLFTTLLHLELISMASVAMATASLLCGIFTRDYFIRRLSNNVVPAALALGWIAGSAVLLVATKMTSLFDLVEVWEPWLACLLLGLLFTLLVFEARRALSRSQPDDFMGIVVVLNATMMSVVSIPFFVIIYGFLYMTREDSEAVLHGAQRQEDHLEIVPVPRSWAPGEP